jgi:hypothetical protein
MSHKSKISETERIAAIEKYLRGEDIGARYRKFIQ